MPFMERASAPVTELSPCASCPRRGRRVFWIAAPASRGRAAPKHRPGRSPYPPPYARAARHAGVREPAGSGPIPIPIPIPIQPSGLSNRAEATRYARANISSVFISVNPRFQFSDSGFRFQTQVFQPSPPPRTHPLTELRRSPILKSGIECLRPSRGSEKVCHRPTARCAHRFSEPLHCGQPCPASTPPSGRGRLAAIVVSSAPRHIPAAQSTPTRSCHGFRFSPCCVEPHRFPVPFSGVFVLPSARWPSLQNSGASEGHRTDGRTKR